MGDCLGFTVRYSTVIHQPPPRFQSLHCVGGCWRVATTALTVRRSNHWARFNPHSDRSHPHSARSHPHSARSHPHSARSPPLPTPHSWRLNFLKESYAYRWYGELSTPRIVDVWNDYLKVWNKGLLKAILTASHTVDSGSSIFDIEYLLEYSKLKATRFQQSCKAPMHNLFI